MESRGGRRICGERGKELLRRRGELLERSFAHAYETGGIRRVFLRGRNNVLKRVLIHVGALNLSLVMRQLLGKGTPRSWQGYSANELVILFQLWIVACGPHRTGMCIYAQLNAFVLSSDIFTLLSRMKPHLPRVARSADRDVLG